MCNKIGGPRILQFSFFEILIQNSELTNLGVADEDLRSKMKSILFLMHYSMVSIIRPGRLRLLGFKIEIALVV